MAGLSMREPFRSYEALLIINGGGGYHVVLAGMDRVDVEIGQLCWRKPVGAMGERRSAGVIADVKAGQPVLYIEFRKDRTRSIRPPGGPAT